MGHEALKVVTAADLAGKQSISEKDQPGGYVGLQDDGGDSVINTVYRIEAQGDPTTIINLSSAGLFAGGELSLNWSGRALYVSSVLSINWGTRELYTAAGLVTCDWDNAILYRGVFISLDWANRKAHDSTGVASINWEGRNLVSVNAVGLMDWSGSSPVTSVINLSDSSSVMKLGFYGATAAAKQTVTGSKGANAALTSLLSKLATLGLITDSTT